jgi:hypothetical protein
MREYPAVDGMGNTDARASGTDTVLGRRAAIFMLPSGVFSDGLRERHL